MYHLTDKVFALVKNCLAIYAVKALTASGKFSNMGSCF